MDTSKQHPNKIQYIDTLCSKFYKSWTISNNLPLSNTTIKLQNPYTLR